MRYSYTLKQNFSVKGAETDFGTNLKYFTLCGTEDSDVQKILKKKYQYKGKNFMTPFACGNLDFSRKNNGFYLGGSSSGAANDVLKGYCDFAIGSDTGGSIRTPASRLNLWAFKSNSKSISRQGLVPLCSTYDSVGLISKDPKLLKKVYQDLASEEEQSNGTVEKILNLEKIIPDQIGAQSVSLTKKIKDNLGRAWLLEVLPDFYSSMSTFNGVFNKVSDENLNKKEVDIKPRSKLPTQVKARILAGAILAKRISDKNLELKMLSARDNFKKLLLEFFPEDTWVFLPIEPNNCLKNSHFEDYYLLIANILDRPVLAIPSSLKRGLQLMGGPKDGAMLVGKFLNNLSEGYIFSKEKLIRWLSTNSVFNLKK